MLAAPAMNVRMWLHPATQRNVATLRGDGVTVMEPDEGEMACGEYGPGRLPEPEAIKAAIEAALAQGTIVRPLGGQPDFAPSRHRPLYGRRILVTAGPTHEPIDPVRYIANRSSGKQGFAIAAAAAEAGAEVLLVAGPVPLPTPPGVVRVDVETAREMAAEVEMGHIQLSREADLVVVAPATADLLAKMAGGIDVSADPMGGETNRVHIVSKAGIDSWDRLPKEAVARKLMEKIADELDTRVPLADD